MLTLYLCFLAGGMVFPLISFLFGFLGNDVDADIDADMDISTDISVDTDFDIDADLDTDFDTGGLDGSPETLLDAGSDLHSVLSFGLLPTSFWSLSSLAITFGAVGSVMTLNGKSRVITLIIAIVTGYLASVVIQTLIKTLKKVQTRSYGINENELLLYDGKIIETILPGQLGTVSFVTLTDVRVSYPARCIDKDLRLETGRIVKAIEFKDGIFLVEPKNKYEK